MQAQTAVAAPNWQGYLDQLIQGGIDYAKIKYLDVPTAKDDANVPDQADLYYGNGAPATTGMTVAGWFFLAAGAVVVLAGAAFVYRQLK